MGPRGLARQHGTGLGLHGNHLELRLPLFQQPGTTSDGAAGTHPRHKGIDLALGISPDLLRRGAFMHGWISGVVELLKQIGVRDLIHQLLGQGDRPIHALGTVGELQLGAISPQHRATLRAHRVRHGENQPVPPGRRHHGQGDAGVATGGLHQHRLAGNDRAGLLRLQHHGAGDAVFHRGGWIKALQLGQDLSLAAAGLGQTVQPHEGRATDQGCDVRSNAHGCSLPAEQP